MTNRIPRFTLQLSGRALVRALVLAIVAVCVAAPLAQAGEAGEPAGASDEVHGVPAPANPETAPAVSPAYPTPTQPVDGQVLTRIPANWGAQGSNLSIDVDWLRCNAANTSCTYTGQHADTYTLTAADVGSRIRIRERGTFNVGCLVFPPCWREKDSTSTPVVAGVAPANTTLPTFTGAAKVGQTLTRTSYGTWSGTNPITLTSQWQRCNTPTTGCTNVGNTDSGTYVLTSGDLGKYIRLAVHASGPGGQADAVSTASDQVAPDPPVNTVPPAITGTPQDGQTLTVSNGSWNQVGPAVTQFSRVWQRCDAAGNDCAATGVTGTTYPLTQADYNKTFKVLVTATGSFGSAAATSNLAGPVTALAPITTAPTISGAEKAGQTLTGTNGTVTGGTGPFTHAVNWQRCDASGNNCLDTGDTDNQYALTALDITGEHTIRFVHTVTGAAPAGLTTVKSDVTGVIQPDPPVNTGPAPSISGNVQQGSLLTANPGGWSKSPTFTYAWQRCDPACNTTVGNAQTYTPVAADVDHKLRVVVTATGAFGQASAASAQTAAVKAGAPQNTGLPTITGTPIAGGQLQGAGGAWNPASPGVSTYRWLRCDAAGAACNAIANQTGTTYDLVAADIGKTIRLEETRTNSGGSAVARSAQTAAVAPDPPAPGGGTPPVPTGTVQHSQTLTSANGSWTDPGSTPTTFTRVWRRCTGPDPTADCTTIPGATATTYKLAATDYGKTIRVVVTATGEFGSASATSAATAPVADLPPENSTLPSIPGAPTRGVKLTANRGAWSGTPATGQTGLAFTYQFIRCDSDGSNCNPIDPSFTADSTYTPGSADVDKRLKVTVRATGAEESTESTSPLSAEVTQPAPPASSQAPGISGTTTEGQTLAATPGFWTGAAPISFAYRWARCDSAGCSDLPVTSQLYQLTSADVGKRVKVRVTATNQGGSAVKESALSAVIAAKAVARPPVTPPKKPVKPKKLKPFPKVQMGGIVARAGAFLNVMRVVNVPKRAKVNVRCRGRTCPFKSRNIKVRKKRATVTKLLKRPLFLGTVIEVRVTRKGYVGKYTRFKIRSNRAPARTDLCIYPGKSKPRKC